MIMDIGDFAFSNATNIKSLTIDDNYPKYVISTDKFDMSQDGTIHKNIINWLLEKEI